MKDSINDYISKHPECEYVILTDPDIQLHNINKDIIQFYIHLLNTTNKDAVGPMLKIDDIPDHYPSKRVILERHGNGHWNKHKKSIEFNGNNYEYIETHIDTTFQLFKANKIPNKFPTKNSIRTLTPYAARHLDWYINPNNLTPCQLFYFFNTTNLSHGIIDKQFQIYILVILKNHIIIFLKIKNAQKVKMVIILEIPSFIYFIVFIIKGLI